jgi:hypothetical protein
MIPGARQRDRQAWSITTRQVVEALETESGAAIDKRKLDMREPIRSLGLHTIRVHLATDLNPSFRVLVERRRWPRSRERLEPEADNRRGRGRSVSAT